MTSQVYYRKWRPSSFSELAGQEHVSTTLRQSVRLGRISHSYLFCGPRGCGKTTTARIIAKAANCLDLQDGDPCNTCDVCRAISDGRFMDIIELDAASNRGIDEIRDIRDKVNFAPVQGRRKVYIIDEAHMLTDAASNAFLKTLEEPPEHVIFVLCTTEAHRILPTIISRCQRLDFRRIPSETVFGRLAEIAEAEGVTVEPAALRMVARYASGSLRDAENLLEQLVVSCPDGVTAQQVEKLLGLGSDETALELVKYLLLGNTTASLTAVNQAAWEGSDLRQLHRQASDLLRGFMHLQWGSEDAVDLPEHVQSQLRELVGKQPPWRIVHALKIWGAVNMRYDAPSTLPWSWRWLRSARNRRRPLRRLRRLRQCRRNGPRRRRRPGLLPRPGNGSRSVHHSESALHRLRQARPARQRRPLLPGADGPAASQTISGYSGTTPSRPFPGTREENTTWGPSCGTARSTAFPWTTRPWYCRSRTRPIWSECRRSWRTQPPASGSPKR